jgi:hypothetical protein
VKKGKKKGTQIPPKAQLAIAIAAPFLVLLVGWLMVVGPQRAKATQLAEQAISLQDQIVNAKSALAHAPKPEPIRVADIFRLTKAMPDQEDMPGIILQLNSVAQESGISFTSIAPGQATPGTGYATRQIEITFTGNFYGLSDYLYRLRNLVGVHGGQLDASGRLFSVDSITFGEGDGGFPEINAKLVIDAYVYGDPGLTTVAPAAPVAPTDGSAPPTSTTTETTPVAPATGAVATPAPTTGVSG